MFVWWVVLTFYLEYSSYPPQPVVDVAAAWRLLFYPCVSSIAFFLVAFLMEFYFLQTCWIWRRISVSNSGYSTFCDLNSGYLNSFFRMNPSPKEVVETFSKKRNIYFTILFIGFCKTTGCLKKNDINRLS